VSHDAVIGSGIIIACAVQFAGHLTVGDGAHLGMGAIVHQRVSISRGVMAGMGSVAVRDVPDWGVGVPEPGAVRGVNRVGLSRAGSPTTEINDMGSRRIRPHRCSL
jgi:UDP-N-acetylglucosamine acyltransferase